jgi:hypothetical protein
MNTAFLTDNTFNNLSSMRHGQPAKIENLPAKLEIGKKGQKIARCAEETMNEAA